MAAQSRASKSLVSRTHSQLSHLMEFSDTKKKRDKLDLEDDDDYVTLRDIDDRSNSIDSGGKVSIEQSSVP